MTVIPIVNGPLGTIPTCLGMGQRRCRNQRMSGDYPDYSIIKMGQNTEKSPGDLRRLAVSQNSVNVHQLALG